MAVTKANILAFVNSKLHVSETDIDAEIQEVLDELSDENLLTAKLEVSDLAAGTTTIAFPTLYKMLVAITLNDGSRDLRPLVAIPGGQVEYRRLIRLSPSQGTPEWYSEFGQEFVIYPTSNGVYTPTIEYFKFHAGSEDDTGADAIEFGNDFTRVLKSGACFNVATRRRMQEQMIIWGQKYQVDKQRRLDNRTEQAYITGGADGALGYD